MQLKKCNLNSYKYAAPLKHYNTYFSLNISYLINFTFCVYPALFDTFKFLTNA